MKIEQMYSSYSVNDTELSASICGTYILIYKAKINREKGRPIFGETNRSLYSFTINKDFKLLNNQIKVNSEFITAETKSHYYACLNFWQRMKLYYFHNRLWFQKEENLRWLLNMIIAVLAVYMAYYFQIK